MIFSKKSHHQVILSVFLFFCVFFVPIHGFTVGVEKKGKEKKIFRNAKEEEKYYMSLKNFAKIIHLVQKFYVEEVPSHKLIEGAIKGMLNSLDSHSSFLPPNMLSYLENETSGSFGGLGIAVIIKDNHLIVLSPIEGSPAWKAGIKAGDQITKINGKTTKGLSLIEAVDVLRGRKNSTVKITILRKEEVKTFKIRRSRIKIVPVRYAYLDKNFVYIRIKSFTKDTTKYVRKEFKKHRKKHKEIAGLILDLRDNPGGLLDQAVQVSDLFLEKGTIVSITGRDKSSQKVSYAKKEGTLGLFPVAVLINGSSASASEIVAAALQENNRATVLGEKSFGKGSVQTILKLNDGSGLKMTIALYYTPKGNSIHHRGVQPDIVLKNIEENKKEIRKKDPKGDLQVQEAIKHLKLKVEGGA